MWFWKNIFPNTSICATSYILWSKCQIGGPGTWCTLYPSSSLYLLIKYFSILFNICPIWKFPLAYGGPSWRVKISFAFLFATLFNIHFSSHNFYISSSCDVELALRVKLIWGKSTICLYSFSSSLLPWDVLCIAAMMKTFSLNERVEQDLSETKTRNGYCFL